MPDPVDDTNDFDEQAIGENAVAAQLAQACSIALVKITLAKRCAAVLRSSCAYLELNNQEIYSMFCAERIMVDLKGLQSRSV